MELLIFQNLMFIPLNRKHLQNGKQEIAAYAFSHVINQVFNNNLATKAYADPHPNNKKASKLCAKLGFVSKPRPEFLEKGPTYMEVTRDTFKSACSAESA